MTEGKQTLVGLLLLLCVGALLPCLLAAPSCSDVFHSTELNETKSNSSANENPGNQTTKILLDSEEKERISEEKQTDKTTLLTTAENVKEIVTSFTASGSLDKRTRRQAQSNQLKRQPASGGLLRSRPRVPAIRRIVSYKIPSAGGRKPMSRPQVVRPKPVLRPMPIPKPNAVAHNAPGYAPTAPAPNAPPASHAPYAPSAASAYAPSSSPAPYAPAAVPATYTPPVVPTTYAAPAAPTYAPSAPTLYAPPPAPAPYAPLTVPATYAPPSSPAPYAPAASAYASASAHAASTYSRAAPDNGSDSSANSPGDTPAHPN